MKAFSLALQSGFGTLKAKSHLAIAKGVNGYEKSASMLSNYMSDMAKWGHTHDLYGSDFFVSRRRPFAMAKWAGSLIRFCKMAFSNNNFTCS